MVGTAVSIKSSGVLIIHYDADESERERERERERCGKNILTCQDFRIIKIECCLFVGKEGLTLSGSKFFWEKSLKFFCVSQAGLMSNSHM